MYDLKNKMYIYFLVCFFSKVFVYLKYIPVLPVMFVHSHLKCCVLIHMLFVLIDILIKHCFYSFFCVIDFCGPIHF